MDITQTLGYGRNGHCGDVHSWTSSGRCMRCGAAAPEGRFERRRSMRVQPNTVFEATSEDGFGQSYRCSVDTGRKVIFWYAGDLVVGAAFWMDGKFQLAEDATDEPDLPKSVLEELQISIRRQIDKRVFGF